MALVVIIDPDRNVAQAWQVSSLGDMYAEVDKYTYPKVEGMTTSQLREELALIGDFECACSSGPTSCGDCQRWISLQNELDDRNRRLARA